MITFSKDKHFLFVGFSQIRDESSLLLAAFFDADGAHLVYRFSYFGEGEDGSDLKHWYEMQPPDHSGDTPENRTQLRAMLDKMKDVIPLAGYPPLDVIELNTDGETAGMRLLQERPAIFQPMTLDGKVGEA